MNATEALIVSIQKPSEDSAWRLVMLLNGELLTATSIGTNGQTPAGPRLRQVLSHLEPHIKGYPFEYGMSMIPDGTKRLAMVRYIGEQMGLVEVTARTLNTILRSKVTPREFSVDEVIPFSEGFTGEGFVSTPQAPVMGLMSLVNDGGGGGGASAPEEETITTGPEQFIVYGEVKKVVDGDTADIEILALHERMRGKMVGKYFMDVGEEITVRFLGIDSPETKKDYDGGYGAKENSELAAMWDVTVDVVFDVAEEAKHTTMNMITPGTSKAFVIIALQYNKKTNKALADSGNGQRPLGTLYQVSTKIKDVDKFLAEMTKPNSKGKNINKTLLGKRYSKDARLPLFQHDLFNAPNQTDNGINTGGWGAEVGYTEPVTKDYKEPSDVDNTSPNKEKDSLDENMFAMRYEEQVSNALDFVVPNDDRVLEGKIYSKSVKLSDDENALEEPFDYIHKVRIGDVLLDVPPLSISMARMGNIEKIKTLRTQSSMMKGVGSANTTLTLDLYFHGMDDINGRQEEAYEIDGVKYYYHMDGLRTLIAQFKKAPFLPIDNHYINTTLNIHNVALHNLKIETVEDFPESLKATLTLSKFEVEAFMLPEPSLSSVMNYPLFRWYYQQAMQPIREDELPGRVYLEPINRVSNDFQFFVADENKLSFRQDAISKVNKMTPPDEYREQAKKKTSEAGKRMEDGKRSQKILGQYKRYTEVIKNRGTLFGINQVINPNGSGWSKEAFDTIYEGSTPNWEKGVQNSFFVSKEYFEWSKFMEHFEKMPSFMEAWEKEGKEAEGVFMMAFGDSENYKKFDSRYVLYKDGAPFKRADGTGYLVIPSTLKNRKILANVTEEEQNVLDEINDYEERYQALVEIVNSTEESVKMVPFDIPDLLPTGMSVIYENQFSSMQVELLDSPTLQYLGGQDPYIQLMFDGTEETVRAVNNMMLLVERYNRQYRQGIVSGFMDVENSILRLMGVKSVMPENISIDTVPGSPGRFQIMMTLCGFNRTQRRLERLQGVSAVMGDTKLNDRYVKNYSKEKDFAVLEYRMRSMEVYPDLELPTFDELNDVLKNDILKTGIKEYKNNQKQYFVDPDFYINSSNTLQQFIKEEIEDKTGFSVITYDNTGAKEGTTTKSKGFLDSELSSDFNSAFSITDKTVEMVPSDLTWKDKDEKKGNKKEKGENSLAKMANVELTGDVADYVKEDGKSKAPYHTPPSYEKWKKYSGNSKKSKKEYEDWAKSNKKNPSEADIWFYVMKKIVNVFGKGMLKMTKLDEEVIIQQVSGTRNSDWLEGSILNSPDVQMKYFYASSGKISKKGNFHYVNFGDDESFNGSVNKLYESIMDWDKFDLDWKKMKKVDSPNGEKNADLDNVTNLLNSTRWTREDGLQPIEGKDEWGVVKIPIHRLSGIIKAIMLLHSRWEVFNPAGKPVLSQGWRAGLMGYPLDIVKDKDQAERLFYDWKYNVDQSLALLHKHYIKASKQNDLRFKSRNLEWMVWQYGVAGQDKEVLPKKEKSSEEKSVTPRRLAPGNGYVNNVMSQWRKAYATTTPEGAPGIYAGGISTLIPEVFAKYAGMEGSLLKAFEGDKKSMIDLMINDLYYPLNIYKMQKSNDSLVDKYDDAKMKKKKQEARNQLQGMPAQKVQVAFFNHLGELKSKMEEVDKESLWEWGAWAAGGVLAVIGGALLGGPLGAAIALGVFAIGAGTAGVLDMATNSFSSRTNEVVDAYTDMTEQGDANANNRLVNRLSPEETHLQMYTDMIEYDKQGRLLRAFPTFQMFIVDEGKWMANYKMWDNLYGFNAIQSIDIYRSRKIAADTATITMTNMYSNLNGRRTDIMNDKAKMPSFFSNITWSQFLLGRPSEDYVQARKELYKSMYLQTGARIHLRMGYGSNVLNLPTVFNGTITEMDTSELVTLVCQGDGLELSNMISGDPDDNNKSFLRVMEPSETIGRLLTSKGGWLRDLISAQTDGEFYKDNPLGIAHFGAPIESPSGNFIPFNRDYGEAAQNIYSSNGIGNFDQWKNEKGENVNMWDVLTDFETFSSTNIFKFAQPGDEDNIIVKYYNNTVWDILQTFAYCSSDYIAAVMPFEMRSTVFFGKPHWGVAYRYDSTYEFDSATGEWTRKYDSEHRKPYMQMHLYNSHHNIISNNIKASEEGVYTNVIVSYDGHVTPVVQADNDIRIDKQKTIVVEADIVGRFPGDPTGTLEKWTSEGQALKYGHSAVRDYMKDMYKGHLLVIGDPTVKPHDAMYMNDSMVDMSGITLVKSVTHHFSVDTGFVTSIEPDAYVTNWDMEMLHHGKMGSAFGAKVAIATSAMASTWITKKVVQRSGVYKWLMDENGKGKPFVKEQISRFHTQNALDKMLEGKDMPDDLKDLAKKLRNAKTKAEVDTHYDDIKKALDKRLETLKATGDADVEVSKLRSEVKSLKKMVRIARTGKGAAKAASVAKAGLSVVKAGSIVNPISLLATAAFTVATETLFEMWRRKKQQTQCVTIFPLQYRGGELVAGINGHQGAVYGDVPSKADKFWNASFGDDEKEDTWYEYISATMNFLAGDSKEVEQKNAYEE